MEQTNLNSKSIFIVPHPAGSGHWLYAPLAGIIAEISSEEAAGFERQLAEGICPDELSGIIEGGTQPAPVAMPEEIGELVILLNQRCNFSCSYCYSKKGRNGAELDSGSLRAAIGWFVTPRRAARNNNELNITFSGGGDPTLSFEKIRECVALARGMAANIGATLTTGLVCNGSLLGQPEIEWMKENIDDIVVSCDIIKEVHDAQRSDFSTVAGTINQLCAQGVAPGIRTTITPLCVERMEEMVDTLHSLFPRCRSVAMEAVLSDALWKDGDELASFYNSFASNLLKAIRRGKKSGITVGNTLMRSADALKSRSCTGKVAVSPEGHLTACSRISAKGDDHFDNFVFGRIENGILHYSEEAYARIMAGHDISREECSRCFARYHCGGGCALARLSYSPDKMAAYCDFVRNLTLNALTYELD